MHIKQLFCIVYADSKYDIFPLLQQFACSLSISMLSAGLRNVFEGMVKFVSQKLLKQNEDD